MIKSVSAADCGGAVQCNCDDVLRSSLNMTGGLNCSGIHNGIRIGAHGITLDCQGHTITGSGVNFTEPIWGIYSSGGHGFTIKNCIVTNFDRGIVLEALSNNNFIINNTAISNKQYGIFLVSYSDNNLITRNTANLNNGGGIVLASNSNNNIITNNTANSNGDYGIELDYSSNNNITNNIAESNYFGIYTNSISNYNTITNNTANSNGFYGVYLRFSSNNNITNNTANSNVRAGIYLYSSSSNILTYNTANSNPTYGIGLYSSSNNTLNKNTANSNQYGVYLRSSSNNNTLTGITANSNTDYGISLSSSSNNQLSDVTANSNIYFGIYLNSSSNNQLTGITANSNQEDGIYLASNSNNNIFQDGNISSNTIYDIYLQLSSINNTFTNVSYDISKEYVASGSQLIRKWYYRAFVNDNLENNVSDASVTAYNRTGDYNFNLTTGSTGYTALGEITDYINNGGTRTFSSNYTISATKPLYQTESHGFNASLGNNYEDVFTLNEVVEVSACGNLGLANTIYTLQNNISTTGTCFNILANNIILDCQGHKLSGTYSGFGIYLNGISVSTIKNCIITNFSYGIWLDSSSNNILTGNTANLNLGGINVWSSSNNNILTGNTANSNVGAGIELYSNSNSTLTGNTANLNRYGILVWTSTNNLLTNNIANLNSYSGILLQYSANNNIVISNTANLNQYSGIYLEWSANNNIVISNTANLNQQFGIGVVSTSSYPTVNNTFNNNTANSNYYGIYSDYSSSTINTNYACGNTNQDFYSFNWYSSYGVNNMCDNPDGWNDTGKTGCTYSCPVTSPNITIISPQNKSYGTNATWMNITLNKAASMCFRSLDNGANVSMTNSSGTWNNKITILSGGSHNVKFYCNDTQNNWAFNTTSFFYCYSDITGPIVGVPDGTVNMRDVNLLITNFNYKCGESRFNPFFDVNDDCTVNMRDINIAIMNFNKKCV